MKNEQKVVPMKYLSSKSEKKGEETRKSLTYNVFRSPRNDYDYFYYTEILYDWDFGE
jgi:hypothetical protein